MTASDLELLRAEIRFLRAKAPGKGQSLYSPADLGKAIAKAIEGARPRRQGW